jgi:hypothetical protein
MSGESSISIFAFPTSKASLDSNESSTTNELSTSNASSDSNESSSSNESLDSNASLDSISIECIMRKVPVSSLYCSEPCCKDKGCDEHPIFMVYMEVSSFKTRGDISFEIGKIHDIKVNGHRNTLGTATEKCIKLYK